MESKNMNPRLDNKDRASVSPMYEKEIRALELFKEKAEKLQETRFYKKLDAQGRVLALIEAGKGAINLTTYWPDPEAIDAFVLTFRFFVQNNDRCSFGNLGEIFPGLPIPQSFKDKYSSARESLNKYLDMPTMFTFAGEKIIRRKIMQVIVYGELAHANPDLKATYDRWMSHPIFSQFLFGEFANILLSVGDLTKTISEDIIVPSLEIIHQKDVG